MFDWTKIDSDPNAFAVREAWMQWYNSMVVNFNLFDDMERDERIIEILAQNHQSLKILDVGFAEHVQKYAKLDTWFHRKIRNDARFEVYGLDLNEAAVNDIRESLEYQNLFIGDATNQDLLIPGRPFDVIHAGDVIEHLSNIQGFLEFCKNNLVAGGNIVITTPNPCAQNSIPFWKNFGILANMEHTCWITPTNMNELCRRSGMTFDKSFYFKNKKRTLKNRLLTNKFFKLKDILFNEFVYVIQKR